MGDESVVSLAGELDDERVDVPTGAECPNVVLDGSVHHQLTDRSPAVESPFDDRGVAVARRQLGEPRTVRADSEAADTAEL